MSTCHAYRATDGLRCSLDAGHDGLHEVMQAWSDDECWSPGASVSPMEPPRRPRAVPAFAEPDEPAQRGPCAICGCSEAAHLDESCSHGCKTYLF